MDLAARGDQDALQQLLIYHFPELCAIIARQIPPSLNRHLDAEDVIQQAYVAAFGSVTSCNFNTPAGFYKWLESIAIEKLATASRDLHRKKRDIRRIQRSGPRRRNNGSPQSSVADLINRLPGTDSTPSKGLARNEARAAVLSSLARLTDDQRAVIQMRFLEGLPTSEIAAALEKSEDAIYTLTHRGLKSLQSFLGSASKFLTQV